MDKTANYSPHKEIYAKKLKTALPEVVEQPIQAERLLKLSVDITVGTAF
jgi:hypothetical protein